MRTVIRFLLVIAGTIATLLLGELGVRALIRAQLLGFDRPIPPGVTHRYSQDYGLIYEMIPNSVGSTDGIPIHVNSLGMRDREYPREKPPGTTRIVVLGDSVTFGPGLPVEEVFTELLEARLNVQSPGKFEVMNLATVGYNSEQERIALQTKALALSPDVILVGYCLNDETATDGLGDMAKHLHPRAPGPRLHSKLLAFVLHRGELLIRKMSSSFSEGDRLISELGVISRSSNVTTVVVVFPYYFADFSTYNKIPRHVRVAESARRNGVTVLDFLSFTRGLSADARAGLYRRRGADRVHFSRAGMEALAAWLFEQRSQFPPR